MTPTLEQVAERQSRLRLAGAIILVSFIAAFLIGGTVLQRINADARARDRRTAAAADQRDREQTLNARINSCLNTNASARTAIIAEENEVRLFVNTLTSGSTDPEIHVRVERFYTVYDALVDHSHKRASCTAEAVTHRAERTPPTTGAP